MRTRAEPAAGVTRERPAAGGEGARTALPVTRERQVPASEAPRQAHSRPAFYALGGGRAGDLLTLLHPPYTAWHLSYFALGAAVAPTLHVDRLVWGLAAFGLAVGLAAHALDELHDRPLGTGLSDGVLVGCAAIGLLGAVAIGVAGALTVTLWLIPFVLAGAAFVAAYNLELFGGRFHSDLWFAIGWGAFPAFTGYFVNAERVALPGVLMAAGCLAMSVAQRRLSSRARELRRRTVAVSGTVTLRDGTTEELSIVRLLSPFDGALAAMSLAMVLTACALVAFRL
jgi:hypothetical protein